VDLPPPPEKRRIVIEPEMPPVVSRKFPLRAVLILSLLPVLALGAFGVYRVTKGPTPDERAMELATKLAPAVLAVYATEGDPAAVGRAVAARREWESDTGCDVLHGAIVPGSTLGNATESAKALIASAREHLPEGAGIGYAVIATNGAIPHVKYMGIVMAVQCGVSPSPVIPGIGS